MDKKTADKMAKQIVDKNPKLRALKSQSQGEKPLYGATHGGKGSSPRTNTMSQEWKDAYDQIDWTANRDAKKSYRVKINGVYVDEEKDV